MQYAPQSLLKVDLHSHTRLSRDGWTTPALLVERARRGGLDRIAITDHNEIDAALEARELAPELVIVGEELDCAEGYDLIGLFLTKRIPPRLSVEEAAAEIRAQGGVVYAPHPFAYLTRPRRRAERLLAVADVVEAFNSRAFYPAWNARALAHAARRGIPVAAGSDGHFPWEIGTTHACMPAFSTATEFLSAVRHATIPAGFGTRAYVHGFSLALMLARMATGRVPWRTPAAPDGPAESSDLEPATF